MDARPAWGRLMATGGAILGIAVACAARRPVDPLATTLRVQVPHRDVRVALAAERGVAPVVADGEWSILDLEGHVIVDPTERTGWGIERRGSRLRARHGDAYATAWVDSTLVLAPRTADAPVRVNGRAYRGVLRFVATDSATLLVGVLPLETYLRGVVPLEMGTRPSTDLAAVEAQAIVARSFAVERTEHSSARPYDLTALEIDQRFGGIAVETSQGDAAVAATAGLVLAYNGRVFGAPYHAVCGGHTASASDVWKTGNAPYLQGVSDRMPGTDRSYCDIAPRFRWERTFTAAALRDDAERYLRQYVASTSGPPGSIRQVSVVARSPDGRVAVLAFDTDGGGDRVRGNDIRFVLRGVDGDLLPSTYFSLEPVVGSNGRLMQLAIRGQGNGHGVGLCQWGAIGRARAGQDVRAILRAYFPAAELARVA